MFIAAQLKNYIYNIEDEIFSEDLEIKICLQVRKPESL